MAESADKKTLDKQIRQRLRNQDKQTSDITIKSDMAKDELELRQFFEDLKQPVGQDPTLVQKGGKENNNNNSSYKQILEQLDLTNLITKIRDYEARTAEEIETLDQVKRHSVMKMQQGCVLGVGVTGVTNWVYRRELTRGVKTFGVVVGILGGAIWGILTSTEYTLRKFENLGHEYQLGRLAIQEIEEFRLDNKQFFKDLH